jgi:hypothetical protein
MSTGYRTRPNIPWQEFLTNLPEGVQVSDHEKNTDTSKLITDGTSYLWCHTGDGTATGFERYGFQPQVDDLLEAIADKFEIRIVSEYEDDFWDETDKVQMDLDDYAVDWAVYVAENGEEKARSDFKSLVVRGKELGLEVTDVYPDNKPIE